MSAATPWPRSRRMVKRAFDLAAATSGLLVLGLPLLFLALLVRWTSPGPSLFRQWRVGRGGRRFRIWKLRTMVDSAAALGPAVTVDGDPRVTRLGRWLRKAKLDELPQLVNVLVGDMSLVGPRPEVPKYVATYSESDRELLAIRPGITDPASIAFRDEESVLAGFPDRERAYVEQVLPRKLALSRGYLREQSFARDLRLLWRTFTVVFRPDELPAVDVAASSPEFTDGSQRAIR